MRIAESLADYGRICRFRIAGHLDSIVLVKRRPSELPEVEMICSLDEYKLRYSCPIPASIGSAIRSHLVKLGHVTEDDLKWVPGGERY